MNDKSHAATPANATSSESNAKPDDGIAGNVTNRNSLHADSHPETVSEYLKRIYPEHYDRIITLMNEDAGAVETADTLSSVRKYSLSIAFVWVDTAEGWHFWEELYKREQSGWSARL